MTKYYRLVGAALLCLATNLLALAQDPEAYWRINTIQAGRTYTEVSDLDNYYFVEIYMPAQLDPAVYKKLRDGEIKVGAIAQGNDELPYPIAISPDDCTTDGTGHLTCSRTHFRIYLPKSIDTSKSYEVYFDSYPISATKALRYRAISIGLDYATSLTNKDPGCVDKLAIGVEYADENQKFDEGKVPLRFLTKQDRSIYEKYRGMRLARISDYLNGLTPAQMQLVDFRVRPLNAIIRPPATVSYTEPHPGEFLKPDNTLWQPTESELPRLSVTSLRAGATPLKVLACIQADKSLPTEDFNTKFTLPPALLPPPELRDPLKKTGISGIQHVASPGKPAADEKVGLRAIDQDLDVAFSFVSSVNEVEKPNPDPMIKTTIKTRERTTRGTLDLRLNPLGTRTWFSDPTIVGTGSNARTTAHYWLLTPLFLDSKVSTGKITKDTLSLNRVVFGIQGEDQFIYDNSTYPTYYRLIGRFSNASDRDFKQAEYKGTFEFRPVLGKFNHPLASIQAAQDKVIVGKDEDDKVFVNFDKGGYEVVPFVGGELGRTWSRRNPAAVIQPSETVKRLYTGLEITWTPVTRTTLTLSDTFYYNFGTVSKRRANYFIGRLDFLLGKFANSNRLASSVFLSFEKGQQPPFSDSGVNVVKLGYRITGQRLFSLVR